MNNKSNYMSAGKWSKKNVQQVLKQLRKAKGKKGQLIFNVDKNDTGLYRVTSIKTGELVFSALNGRFDYLVRFDTRLFNPAK
jgi:hypothetical protein